MKKIAIVHDYIKEYGGAERVLETLHEMYPHAPVYTLVYCPEFLGPHADKFREWHIIPSILQFAPFKEKLISPFRLLAPIIFRLFDFSGYDIVIVSATGAYSPNIIRAGNRHKAIGNRQGTIRHKPYHICYCHTPPRYLYGYATARNWQNNPIGRVLGTIANHILRMVDFVASENVDQYIANSQNVALRIKKFYRKNAVVIYPPIDTVSGMKYLVSSVKETRSKNTKYQTSDTKYYLAGGRLARPKHIDLIIQAANELKIPLKIFGKGFAGYGEELKKLAGETVEFFGEVSDEKKQELLAGAKAYIFAGEDEDLGMLPIEAMAQGTAVIAYRSGGVVETIVEGKTGIFFNELTVESLVKAIKRFGKTTFARAMIVKQAQKFSKEEFVKSISALIMSV